jgi:hypothetical protein
MASSQFTIYSSSDGSAPSLTGAAGSLIALFKACLIDGYGSKTPPSPAWSQPVATASNIGSFKPGAGSQMAFVLNDNGGNVTSTFKEAWATGWESVAGVGSPVGSGSGQFPTAAQLLTSGHVVIRKSATADSTVRNWIMFADSYTLYFFALTGDSAGVYYAFMFGDIYSLKLTTDTYRGMIIGRNTENSSTGINQEGMDTTSFVNIAVIGSFMPRTYGGGGTSITVGKHGDVGLSSSGSSPIGMCTNPNGPDNSYYLAPYWVTESSGSIVRGRMRGFYQICHPIAGFSDGQTFSGSGDYAGKTFQVVKQSANSSLYCVEISNTVETN